MAAVAKRYRCSRLNVGRYVMRRSLLLVLLLACGCQKSSMTPVAQVKPTEPNVGPSDSPRKAPLRTKRVPLAQRPDRSMVPLPPPPPPPPKAKPTLAKDEAVAAVVLFLTTKGSTTAASYNSKESQEIRPQIGGGYATSSSPASATRKSMAKLPRRKSLAGWCRLVSPQIILV